MAGKKIRFALIGCGAISQKHITALSKVEGAEIIGAFDINPDAAAAFGKKHGVSAFTDMDELVAKTSPDVFNILTPSGLHAQNILDLIKYEKHFVVEKPLALRLDQIDRILAASDAKGLKIFVVKQNRFNTPVAKLHEALEKGRFGKLVMGTVRVRWSRNQSYYNEKSWRGTWAFDGGVLTNQASHHIDMLLWMMGDVESVMAKIATRLVDIEAEDTGVALLKFKNGALGIIEATTATRPKDIEGSISVLGEKGSVEVGGFFVNELKVWNFAEPDPMDDDIWEKHAKVPNEPAWNHAQFFRDVVASLKTGKKGLIDGIEGRKSIELINAIYESAETGKEVQLHFTPSHCKLGIINDK